MPSFPLPQSDRWDKRKPRSGNARTARLTPSNLQTRTQADQNSSYSHLAHHSPHTHSRPPPRQQTPSFPTTVGKSSPAVPGSAGFLGKRTGAVCLGTPWTGMHAGNCTIHGLQREEDLNAEGPGDGCEVRRLPLQQWVRALFILT